MEIPQNRYLFAVIETKHDAAWFLYKDGILIAQDDEPRISPETISKIQSVPLTYRQAAWRIAVWEGNVDGFEIWIAEFEEKEGTWNQRYLDLWIKARELNALLELAD